MACRWALRCSSTTTSTFLAKPGLYLEDLFVRPEHRGCGLGKALIKAVAKIAVEHGCGRYEWTVLDWNQPAIDFYQSLGAEMKSDSRIMRVTGEALNQHGRRMSGKTKIGRRSGWRSSRLFVMKSLRFAALLFSFSSLLRAADPDIVVYGGVPCGIAASIAAAHDGAKVLLVEPTKHVGGLSTSGLNTAETEHMLKWTFGGIALEFYQRMGRAFGSDKPAYYFTSSVAEKTYTDMLKEAGVEVQFGARVEQGDERRHEDHQHHLDRWHSVKGEGLHRRQLRGRSDGASGCERMCLAGRAWLSLARKVRASALKPHRARPRLSMRRATCCPVSAVGRRTSRKATLIAA